MKHNDPKAAGRAKYPQMRDEEDALTYAVAAKLAVNRLAR